MRCFYMILLFVFVLCVCGNWVNFVCVFGLLFGVCVLCVWCSSVCFLCV